MGRINTVPGGLQSLLGSTNFGDNPSDLAVVTAPVLEQFPFLAQQKVYFARNVATLASRGSAVQVTVEEGEIWKPIAVQMSLNGNINIGTDVRMTCQIFRAPNAITTDPAFAIHSTGLLTSTVVGEIMTEPFRWPDSPWLQSGTGIRLHLDEYVPGGAGNDSFEIQAMYYKLDV